MIRLDNQCAGKIAYKTKEEANMSVKNLNNKRGKRLVSYICSSCGSVHIGHQSKGRMFKHDQKSKKINYIHVSGRHRLEE